MNWTRIALAGGAAGLATWILDGVVHGVVMASTYERLNQVFTQTQANPVWFLLISVTICFMIATLFARTRGSWAAGTKGGLTFGFFVGLVLFFQNFYFPLVIDGYPYYLVWCQGGISMMDSLLAGAVLGSILKS